MNRVNTGVYCLMIATKGSITEKNLVLINIPNQNDEYFNNQLFYISDTEKVKVVTKQVSPHR